MKTLNLNSQETSEIKYKVSKFPDQQQQLTIDINSLESYKYCQINTRLNNWLDLELLVCSVASLRNLGVKDIYLYCPLIIGSRSDRQFEEGSNNYLKQVICPIINSLNFESVTVLDPHSSVLEACLNNFKSESNLELVRFFRRDMAANGGSKDCILVSPDAGASHKIYKLAEQIGYKGDIITCSKERDAEGKLTRVVVPLANGTKDYIIIDDICDAGFTFINIAKQLKPYITGNLYLIVTHGIFSKGLIELRDYFDGIYCTNSYSDWTQGENHYLKQLKVI